MDRPSQQGCDKMHLTCGDKPGEFCIRVKVDSLFEVIRAVIQQGGLKQASIAEALELGPDYFSKKFGNPGDCFYAALEQFEKIMDATGQITPLEYMLRRRGYQAVPIQASPPVNEAAQYESKQRAGELPNP